MSVLLRAVDDLPALPAVAVRVARLSSEDVTASTQAIAQTISADPALAARVLRLANSAYYGLPRRIGTIREALLVLGLRSLRAITLAAALHNTLSGPHWRHAIATAVCAEALARGAARQEVQPRMGFVAPDEAFVAGLLHDVGKIAIESVFSAPALAARFRETLRATGQPRHVAESSLLGFDHAEAGAALAEKWNLPASLVDAVRWHHDPLRAGHGNIGLATLVHAASALGRHLRPDDDAGDGGEQATAAAVPSPLCPDALEALGLPGDLTALAPASQAALESAAGLFALGEAGEAGWSVAETNAFPGATRGAARTR